MIIQPKIFQVAFDANDSQSKSCIQFLDQISKRLEGGELPELKEKLGLSDNGIAKETDYEDESANHTLSDESSSKETEVGSPDRTDVSVDTDEIQNLKDQIQDYEQTLTALKENLETQQEKHQLAIDTLKNTIAGHKTTIEKKDEDLESVQSILTESQNTQTDLNQQLTERTIEYDQLAQRYQTLDEEHKDLQTELTQQKEQNTALQMTQEQTEEARQRVVTELSMVSLEKESVTLELKTKEGMVSKQKKEMQNLNQQLTDHIQLLAIDKLATLERFCTNNRELAQELNVTEQSRSWPQRLTIMKYLKNPQQLQIFWQTIGGMDTPLNPLRIDALETAIDLFNAQNIKKQATIQKVSIGDTYNFHQHDSNKHGGHGNRIAEVYCYGLQITAFEPLLPIVKRTRT